MNQKKIKQLKKLARNKAEEKLIIAGYKNLNQAQRDKFAKEFKKVQEQQKALSVNQSKNEQNDLRSGVQPTEAGQGIA